MCYNNNSPMKLRSKLVVIFLTISIFPIIFLSFYILKKWENEAERQTFDSLAITAESTESYILIFLDKQKVRMVDWATDGYVRDKTEDITERKDVSKVEELAEYLRTQKQPLAPNVLLVDIIDLEGKIIVSTKKERINHIESALEKFNENYSYDKAKNAQYGQVFMSDLIIEEGMGHPTEPMFHLSSPIFSNKTGKVLGVLVNHVYFNELNELLSGAKQMELSRQERALGWHKKLNLYLINRKGLVIASSPPRENFILKKSISSKIVLDCLNDNEESVARYKNHDGINVYGSSACPVDNPWMLLMEASEDDVLAATRDLRRIIIFVVLAISVLVTLLGFVFEGRMARRILPNLRAVQEIGRGNMKARVDIVGNDVITEVGKGINKMAEELEKTISKEKLLARVVNSTTEGVLITDKGTRDSQPLITYVNPAWEEMFGWKFGEVVGKEKPSILKSGKQSDEYYGTLWETITKGEVFESEIVDKRKDGSLLEIESIILPIKDEEGNIINYVNISHNIAKRKEAERKEKELGSLKNEFITVVSHQMRTPLTGIRWGLETILSKGLGEINEHQENIIKSSYNASVEIAQRIDDLFYSLEIEERKMRLDKEEAHLDSLVNSTILELDKRIKDKKIKLNFIKPENRSLLKIDSPKIKQVIVKLLDNAIKYTGEGGEISLKIEEKGDEIFFTINDNGIGIPQDDQNKIFTKFYRASNAFTAMPDSSGLGLFVAKNIVEAHGGKLWFSSQEGQGSSFYFKLPINNT